ncbi:hypothetical protein [Proteus hauseri]|uniref:hypothetical protein n=1 Tax=Proteus hauseri TaxID=183417 RepID=UPI001EFE6587|nr:hypothetical protein [Proteus hauseri]
MKKICKVVSCLFLLLTAASFASENKVIGSGTITFVGTIVEGNCEMETNKNTLKQSVGMGLKWRNHVTI